ncbi:hypothetical protein HMPREF9141_2170 [Prevotella multiformis DSM 16608]|uniref:Uncharacterized protein n=1 Tax=Prevotella multiformis DSM 16608 TaxID=888743 RepID=F0F9A3_9BACT|nr:hypothetical protein HMPREF9141_2170 [Prevotella multiformis DSM 16608]
MKKGRQHPFPEDLPVLMKQKRTALSKHEMRGQGFFSAARKRASCRARSRKPRFTEHYH